MSDNETELAKKAEAAYQERSQDEVDVLANTFRRGGEANYVAHPAPGYDVHGLWHSFGAHQRTGYAAHAIALHWMISKRLGIHTELIPHRHVDIDIEKFPEDRYDMLFGWMKEVVGRPHAIIASYTPEVAMHMGATGPGGAVGPNLVNYCAFEGTRVSAMCRDLCNGPLFRKVWVVSGFVRNAMIAGGVKPERVITLRPPMCDGPWAMPSLDELAIRPRERLFTFGSLGTWQKRKGMHDLVRAYFGAFRRDEAVQLVIRTSRFTEGVTIREFQETLTGEVAAIAREFGDDHFPRSCADGWGGKQMPRLRFLLGLDATDAEIIEWLSQLDCYANPSYGEGLGIPHIWAKANGVPMVTTNYGAIGDLISEISASTGVLDGAPNVQVPHRLEPVTDEILRLALMFERGVEWGVYDAGDFGAGMRTAYERGHQFDRHGAEYVRQAFSIDACLPALREGLSEILDPQQVQAWKLGSTS